VGAALCNLAEKGVIKKTGLVCVQARHYNDKVKLRKVALSPFLGKIREPILIIDDVIDTGDTIRAVKRRIKRTNIGVAVIFKKPWSRVQPDYYVAQTDRWVVFPWEEGRE
jgi:hypoxanthine phosphoribosyltransferase